MTLKSSFKLFRSKASSLHPAQKPLTVQRRAASPAWMVTALSLAMLASPLTPAIAASTAGPLPTASSLSGSYLSGRSALFSQDMQAASTYFSEALKRDPDNYYLMDRAFVSALANGEISKALPLASIILQEDDEHFLSQLLVATENLHDGSYNELPKGSVTQDVNPLSRLTFALAKAWMQAGQGDSKAAVRELTSTTGPKWFDLFVNYNAGLIEEYAGDAEASADFFKKSYEIDPGALRNALAYARMLAASSRQQEALDIITEYDKLIPNHPLLVDLRQKIESGAVIEPVVSSPSQGFAEALFALGAALSKDGEEMSAAYLQLSTYLSPQNDSSAMALGALFEQLGDNKRAIDYLSRVSDASPMKREAEIQIALHYNILEDLDQSRKHLEDLVAQDPKDIEAITSLGNVLRSNSLFEESEVAYSKAINSIDMIEENHWALLYFRGITRERLNMWGAAEEDFRQALTLRPEQPMVLNYLGYSLVDRGLKLDEALGMIERAVRLRPTDGYIVDSLGWVYYRLGRYEEAVEELERAVTLRPHDPIINDHLGDAYWQVGRKLEARYKWNHARDLDPEPKDLERILGKIENGLEQAVPVGLADATEPAN